MGLPLDRAGACPSIPACGVAGRPAVKFFFSDADKRRWIIGAWLAVVAGVLWVAVKIVMGPLYEPLGLWRWFESNAVYYRITTDLETEGQPFQLDVIVRCGGVGSVSYIGGGGAVYYQQLPYLYGKPTPAGHAVLMRVPNFCGLIVSGYPSAYAYREKLKQKVDILPLMLWMPDKNDIERMTAYTSLAGYESEGSQLRYRGTRYAEVTRPEWKSWMESSGKPFITRANDPFFKWRPVEGRDGRGLRCYAVRLNTIPEELRDEVARAPRRWPARMDRRCVVLPPLPEGSAGKRKQQLRNKSA
ncbi:hypothetical protein [Bosea sp. 685]|uniref:hypothetical protein n=1 Tax=Bosea sp. 685 TaxID=3080057 RepID=UPI002892B34F|nr:hypothetical protein [Bosea sp. 685]WNJ88705.1 hypothetical protein RMR04_20105 [Bosea sp. 685]